jgi:hypothetical protein
MGTRSVRISNISYSGDHNRLNRMHTIFRLVKGHRVAAAENFIRYFHLLQAELLLNFLADAGFSVMEVPKGLPAKHANTPFISRSSADPSCKDEGWSNDKELRQSLYWVALLWVQAHSCYCSIYNISTMCSDANDMSRCN